MIHRLIRKVFKLMKGRKKESKKALYRANAELIAWKELVDAQGIDWKLQVNQVCARNHYLYLKAEVVEHSYRRNSSALIATD